MQRKNLTRSDIELGLKRLSDLAKSAHRMVDIAVYGGSAIMLAWDLRAMTNDVDAIIMDARHTDFVRKTVKQIAGENNWHEDWLNDAIKGFILNPQHLEKLDLFPESENGGIRVYVPIPEYFLAMKCMAMRLDEEDKQDDEDIKNILKMLSITDPEVVFGIVEKYYPQNVILPKTRFGLIQLMDELKHETTKEPGFSPGEDR